MKRLMLVLLASVITACGSGGQSNSSTTVSIYNTNESVQFAMQASQTFLIESHTPNIIIDDSITYQQIEGFGAAITDSSAYLLYSLPEPIRTNTLQQLFGKNGASFSMIRVPISASDFSLYNYTYDDMPFGESNPSLSNFSIFHDMTYIIPLLKLIKQINPDVKLIATPWSAPAWMKTNQNYFGTYNGAVGELLDQYMLTYAKFLMLSMSAYESNGLHFDYLTVQNEPLFAPDTYGGMFMSANQQSIFINDYLTPEFIANDITTKVLTYDHNWDHPEYPAHVLNNLNQVSNQIVSGTAYHCYGGNVDTQSITHQEFPNKKIFMTECSGGDWAPNFGDNLVWDMQNLFIGNLNNWGNGATKWNFALDQNNGPYVGGCTDCRGLITINTTNNNITYNVDYYSTANMSKFIMPGAYRIASSSDNSNIMVTAVKNPDGQIVTMLVNSAESSQNITLNWKQHEVNLNIPSQTVTTVVWY